MYYPGCALDKLGATLGFRVEPLRGRFNASISFCFGFEPRRAKFYRFHLRSFTRLHCQIMADEILLNEAAYAVWQAVYAAGANGVNLDELANKFHVDQSQVAATSVEAQKCGYFKIDEQDCEELIPCEGARELIDNRALPEERAVCYLLDTSVLLSLPEFIEWAKV